MQVTTIRLSAQQLRQLDAVARSLGCTRSEALRRAADDQFRHYLKQIEALEMPPAEAPWASMPPDFLADANKAFNEGLRQSSRARAPTSRWSLRTAWRIPQEEAILDELDDFRIERAMAGQDAQIAQTKAEIARLETAERQRQQWIPIAKGPTGLGRRPGDAHIQGIIEKWERDSQSDAIALSQFYSRCAPFSRSAMRPAGSSLPTRRRGLSIASAIGTGARRVCPRGHRVGDRDTLRVGASCGSSVPPSSASGPKTQYQNRLVGHPAVVGGRLESREGGAGRHRVDNHGPLVS